MPADIGFSDLQFIIEFVYRGEIDVSETELQVGIFFLLILVFFWRMILRIFSFLLINGL